MAKREYLVVLFKRYVRTKTRNEKSKLLDEICITFGCHRKHAVRLLSSARKPRPRALRRGRPRSYGSPDLVKVLKKIWFTANLPCSKRLHALLPLWISKYEEAHGALEASIKKKLRTISSSSIERLLERSKLEYRRKGRATTKPGTLLRKKIPILVGQWNETRPGFLEADTVAHCGTTIAGQFAWTLDCVDIATGWSEQRAVWNKKEDEIVRQLRSIEKSLPFPMLGFDSDNGTEFMNQKVLTHFMGRQKPIQFTRSRPYKKDDNAHIEQKNWTHVRQWLGYDRLDVVEVITALNDLFTTEWRIFHNFYCPSAKLISKDRVGSKTIKKHDRPKTPYQRVMESPSVDAYHKRGLEKILEESNPFLLREAMDRKIKKVFEVCEQFQTESRGNISRFVR